METGAVREERIYGKLSFNPLAGSRRTEFTVGIFQAESHYLLAKHPILQIMFILSKPFRQHVHRMPVRRDRDEKCGTTGRPNYSLPSTQSDAKLN